LPDRQKQHGTYNLVLDTVRLAPGTHDERIIERQYSHNIHFLALDIFQRSDVSWQVPDGAARGEGAGDGKEDDFLVSPFFAGVVVLWDATGGDLGRLGGVRDVTAGAREICQHKVVVSDGHRIIQAYEKTTSSGNLSPSFSPAMFDLRGWKTECFEILRLQIRNELYPTRVIEATRKFVEDQCRACSGGWSLTQSPVPALPLHWDTPKGSRGINSTAPQDRSWSQSLQLLL
jgi:hypothetical protein